MASLLIKQDQQILQDIRLFKAETKIGSASECDIQLPDQGVSPKHACITLVDGLHFLEDLRSRNGVLLNGEKIQRVQLQSSDKLAIHSFQLEFITDEKKRY